MTKHIRKLTRAGRRRLSIVVPAEIVKKYGWREKQKLVLTDKKRGKVEIRDWKSK